MFCGIFMLIFAVLFETPCLPSSGMGWFGVIFLSIFCTGLSFIVQTVIIICGVFGVSLFSGLSLPLVAKGNFEMWMNGICCGIIYGSITYSSD